MYRSNRKGGGGGGSLGGGRSRSSTSREHHVSCSLELLFMLGVAFSLVICAASFFVVANTHAIAETSSTANEASASVVKGKRDPLKRPLPKVESREQQVIGGDAMDPSSSLGTGALGIGTTIAEVQAEFKRRYAEHASTIQAKGIQRFGRVRATAERLLRAAAHSRSFRVSFGGYSITVGRGNHFHQSYPFVFQRILRPVLQRNLHIDLVVINAAIGGIPSFPYGFCFPHFLGEEPDVIGWDYSMNEQGKDNVAVLEAYIRHAQHQLPSRPMILALDTHEGRCKLLQSYTDQGLVPDAACVAMAAKILPKSVLEKPSSQQPDGLKKWDEFGAAGNCPGRGSWHPKRKEHELIGWSLVLYFLDAIDEALKIIEEDPQWKETYVSKEKELVEPDFAAPLAPERAIPQNDPGVNEMLFGHPQDGGNLLVKDVSCRTSFLPSTDQSRLLPSIVVDGLTEGPDADNIMEDRTDAQYEKGWVIDVSPLERNTKVKVEKCGGLGYIDMKIALYGTKDSGKLRLWLPVERGQSLHTDHDHSDEDQATHWFDSLVLCEANEKRKKEACQLDKDLIVTVGGQSVQTIHKLAGASEYLKRSTCVNIPVPENAVVTRFSDLNTFNGAALAEEAKTRLLGDGKNGGNGALDSSTIGLIVDVEAASHVTRDGGACCLSHVVWEQH